MQTLIHRHFTLQWTNCACTPGAGLQKDFKEAKQERLSVHRASNSPKPIDSHLKTPSSGYLINYTSVLALFSCSGSYCLVLCYARFFSFRLFVSRSWGFPTWTGTELHICVMFQNVKSLLLWECLYFFLAPSASLWFQEEYLEIYWILWIYFMCIFFFSATEKNG